MATMNASAKVPGDAKAAMEAASDNVAFVLSWGPDGCAGVSSSSNCCLG